MPINIDTALVFENTDNGSSMQIEKDAEGYSVTVFDADGSSATMQLDQRSLVRITNFLNEELS